jgi:RNA polymerase sigma factor (sigma-70 family)
MVGYCTRRLRSRSEAEDAAQTTFLYALRALRRGVVPECESAWLHTIAKNVCSWQQRTAWRRAPLAPDVEVDLLAAAPEGEDAELLVGLSEALASLPRQQQRALVMREWHGIPAREIAVELGLTAPQTHALLTRARQALAHALTAPGKAALGLVALVCGLRANVKALVGGVAAKAAAAVTIVAAGAGVTGAVAEESDAKRAARERAIATMTSQAVETAVPPAGSAVTRVPGERGAGAAAVPTRNAPAGPGTAKGDETSALDAAPAPGGGAPSAEPAPGAQAPTPPSGEAPSSKPLAAVPPVTVDLPTELLPPVVLPPVELPPVQLPPVELPVELPVEVPTVEVPTVELPAVQIPPLVEGEPPLVNIPPTQVVVPPLRPLP